ncbi:MAG TPA: phosphoribosylglycinamide formyltransferase [Haliangiales bacterium]|nr:phosphoribosylglycinamide formyltransferase [Haliangiales bacterium]
MKLAVLVSGTGTNLQALLDAERRGALAPGEIACVVSNRPGVRALDRAELARKPAAVVDHTAFPTREAFEDAVAEVLDAHGVEAVVLAGFMRMLTPRFLARYPDRIINIHPSLLPAFPGVNAQKQALDFGVRVTGATVHFVSPEMDGGAIILQAAVAVFEDDTVEELRDRILVEEHWLLPRATQLLCAGKLVREGRRVRIR